MDPIAATLSILILLISVIIHEVMHGFVALKFGDHTAENAGRLTLNPLPHIDPIGSILLPLLSFKAGFFIGWAKPVPINPLNFTDIRKGELWVSAAGILSNLGLAILGAVLYHTLPVNPVLSNILIFVVRVNLMLAVFNLIPIPPLDGSKVLMSLLPYESARSYMRVERYGFLIIIVLAALGVFGVILSLVLQPIFGLLGIPF